MIVICGVDAAKLATMQPAVSLMKLNIVELQQSKLQLKNDLAETHGSYQVKIEDLMRGNKDLELRVAETELERNQLHQTVQHLNDKKDNCEVEIKKLVTQLEKQSRKAVEEKHEQDNKIRDGAMTCEELRKEILNYKQELRQLKAGVDPKIG